MFYVSILILVVGDFESNERTEFNVFLSIILRVSDEIKEKSRCSQHFGKICFSVLISFLKINSPYQHIYTYSESVSNYFFALRKGQ